MNHTNPHEHIQMKLWVATVLAAMSIGIMFIASHWIVAALVAWANLPPQGIAEAALTLAFYAADGGYRRNLHLCRRFPWMAEKVPEDARNK